MSATAPITPVPALNPRRWLVAVVMMVAALMDLLDATVVNVALPTMQRDLRASGDQLAWVVSAYLLAFAASLITAGQLGDRFGRRRLFLLGTAAFGVASLASALAQTPGQLIAFRVVQGAAAATVAPQVLATFRVIFPAKERGQAFAMYGAVGGLAASLGLIAGGALTSADLFGTGWRMVFLVNVPIAVAILAASIALVPETRVPNPLRPDVLGHGAHGGGDRGRRLPAAGRPAARVAGLVLAPSGRRGRGPRRAVPHRRPAPGAGRGHPVADTAAARPGVRGRHRRAAVLLGRDDRVDPGADPVGPDRPGLVTDPRRGGDDVVRRGDDRDGADVRPAGAAARAQRAGRRRRAHGRRHRRARAAGPAHARPP